MTRNISAALAAYAHPRVITVLLLGFSSGLPRLLVASTLGAWLLDSGVDKAAVGLFAYVALPYSFNFLWAPLADHLRLPWLSSRFGRRRGWMLLSQAALLALLLYMGGLDPAISPYAVAAVALLIGFFSATQDIVIDAYRAELLDREEYGQGAAAAVFGYRLGMLAAGAGALYLADWLDWSVVYPAMGALMPVGMATALLAGEPRGPESGVHGLAEQEARPGGRASLQRASCDFQEKIAEANGKNISPRLRGEGFFAHAVLEPFRDFAARHEKWWLPLLFILFYRVPDGFIGFMTTPFLLDIGFGKSTVAGIGKLYGFGATIAGAVLGGALIGRLGVMRCLWIFLLFQMAANALYAAQAAAGPDALMLIFTVSMDNLSGGMVTAAAVAYMMSLCSSAHTATQYALLSSLASLASITLAGAAGWIAAELGWEAMFLLSAAMGLPALAAYRGISRTRRPEGLSIEEN